MHLDSLEGQLEKIISNILQKTHIFGAVEEWLLQKQKMPPLFTRF